MDDADSRGGEEPAPLDGIVDAVDVAAGIGGLAVGVVVSPLLDRLATNAPRRARLLATVPLSKRFPLVVLGAAMLGGACGLAFGATLEAFVSALFCWVLVVITRTDLEHRLIPNAIVLPGTVLVLAGRTVGDPSVEWVIAAAAAGLVLFLVVLVYPSGMGMGDVKLSAFLGAGLGLSVVVGLFIGFFAAFVPAAILLVRHGRAARKRAIPLGPFLALGAVVALFAGDAILDWYTELGAPSADE